MLTTHADNAREGDVHFNYEDVLQTCVVTGFARSPDCPANCAFTFTIKTRKSQSFFGFAPTTLKSLGQA